jgi:uncharacterized pyridoxal phosphate-containing UPF0001 family protein
LHTREPDQSAATFKINKSNAPCGKSDFVSVIAVTSFFYIIEASHVEAQGISQYGEIYEKVQFVPAPSFDSDVEARV